MFSSLAVIFLSLILGTLLKRFNFVKLFNNIIIFIFLPSLILAYIPSINLLGLSQTLILSSSPWILFLLSFLYFSILKNKLNIDKSDLKMLVLVNGLGNTAFLGYPLIKSLLGESAMPPAIIVDQLGTFLILSSLATIYASAGMIARENYFKSSFKKLFTFPPFLSLLLSLIFNQNEILLQFNNQFKYLSFPLTPFAIMVLGMQLNFDWKLFQKHSKLILVSMIFKLILFPVLVYLIYKNFISGTEFQAVLLQSAMAPMFSSLILINKFQLKSELAALIIFCGVIVSLITVPLWSIIL
jgi:predicted permease